MEIRTVGLVGAGGVAAAHLPAWRELGMDVIVFSQGGSAGLVERYGGRVVESYDALLRASDVVDVCTPTFTHRDLVVQAAAARKPVVCEKPLARTADDAREMVAACERAGVVLFPAHILRFFPEYSTARDTVDRGDLGAVAVQRLSRIGAMPQADWFWDRALSGGIAMDQMIHDLDFARWTAGEVETVYATASGGAEPRSVVAAQVILKHRSGTISQLNGVWGSVRTQFHTRFEIAGRLGLLSHDSRNTLSLVANGVKESRPSGFPPATNLMESPYVAELREFLDVVENGSVPRVIAADGVAAVELAEAAVHSIETGTVVTLEVNR